MSCEYNIWPPRRVLVIGGTRGIGFALVIQLVYNGFDVIVSTRDPDASKELQQAIPPGKLHRLSFVTLHLDSIETVNQDLPAIVALHQSKPFDIVVLNAAVMFPSMPPSASIEPAFQVNYLSHFMISKALVATSPGHPLHFVTVSSSIIKLGLCFPNTTEKMTKAFLKSRGTSGWKEYTHSKACLTALACDLGAIPNVTSTIVDPGNASTDLSRNMPKWQRRVLRLFMRHTLIPVDQAAGRVLKGVLSPVRDSRWFTNRQLIPLPAYILEPKIRQCLAEFTEKILDEYN